MTNASTTPNDLGLTAKARADADIDLLTAEVGGCGGGCNCTCGANDSAADVIAVDDDGAQVDVVDGPVTVTYEVLGMTCAHCVSSVREEMFDLEGVQNVAVELKVGGASTVAVTSAAPLDPAAVDAAVTEAGYELVGTTAASAPSASFV
jgi:copper chaperone